VVCGDLAARVAQLPDSGLVVRHAGVMEHGPLGRVAALALAVVRRRSQLGDDGGLGTQLRRNHMRTAGTFAGATCTRRKARRVRRRRLCRNDDARQARLRALARRLRGIRGYCCRRAVPLKTRRSGRPVAAPTVQLRDAFRPAYATHSTFPTIRYSLDVPDNTLLAHRPRQHATWLMFPERPC